MEDMRGQQLAYNTHLDTIRGDHERALAFENEKQNVQHQSNLGKKRKLAQRRRLQMNKAIRMNDKD